MATRSRKNLWVRFKDWSRGLRERGLHQSFRRTKHRDAVRPLGLAHVFRFTHEVNRLFWRYKKPLLWLLVVYLVLYIALVGLGSQDSYANLIDALEESGGDIFSSGWGALGQAGLLFGAIATVGLSDSITEAQQVYLVLLALLVWLTTVWLLRNLFAGNTVKLRDAIYNAGAPLVPTFLVSLVLLIQLLPFGVAAIGYIAATTSGLIDGGVEAMLFWVSAGLLTILSLFWATSTLFAMVIVTLPGMYPMRSLSIANQMIAGRRLQVLGRWLWMLVYAAVIWALVLIPIILLDGWLKSVWTAIDWLPIVPVVSLLLSALTISWISVYVYTLYRKVVEADAESE